MVIEFAEPFTMILAVGVGVDPCGCVGSGSWNGFHRRSGVLRYLLQCLRTALLRLKLLLQ